MSNIQTEKNSHKPVLIPKHNIQVKGKKDGNHQGLFQILINGFVFGPSVAPISNINMVAMAFSM